jgi:oxygen-independent coproporphyrinogen-3 oxidase
MQVPLEVAHSLYIHIPFCRHRCGYCDFNTYAGLENLIPAYTNALCREMTYVNNSLPGTIPVHSIYLGGGTPSLLPVHQLEQLIKTIQNCFNLQPGLEFTMEANPGTLNQGYLQAVRSLGVNRLSLGTQSANPQELFLLDRQHSYLDVIDAVKWARIAEFDNISLDLIFGIPNQSLLNWQRSLELSINLGPEHLSLYALSIEVGTPMYYWLNRGYINLPDPDLAAEMYEWAMDRLERAGYQQYEISNWASQLQNGDSRMCKHNLQYWRNQPYLGLGAGAHGYAGHTRTANVLSPQDYIQRMQGNSNLERTAYRFPNTPATQTSTVINKNTEIEETMIMGLRLVSEGISDELFHKRFKIHLDDIYKDQIHKLEGLGLLEWVVDQNDRRLCLTRNGRLLGNQVFIEFLS